MSDPKDLYGRPWSEREFIIVLDLYFNRRGKNFSKKDLDIIEIANKLDRSPASITMRMDNFSSIDPENNEKKGLIHGGNRCRIIFERWAPDMETLKKVAEVLIRDISRPIQMPLFEPLPIKIPKAFGKYELQDFIGEGGFGVVYSCIDTQTDKPAAIKFIKTEKIYDERIIHRFRREIKALGMIEHLNIIRLHEDNLDYQKSYPAFVMDLAQNSLTDHLNFAAKKNPNPDDRPVLHFEEAQEILISIFEATIALHHNEMNRVIHRDINPDNILKMLTGDWVLADFSLVKFIETAQTIDTFCTQSGDCWGKGYYTAPEQWRNFKLTDERTDIYALGTLIWELFSSSHPPPRGRDSYGLPKPLEKVFLKATETRPEMRYQTVEQLSDSYHEAIKEIGM